MTTKSVNETKGYEKPRITKEETMRFPLELLEATGQGVVCKQCSSCHGCR